MSAPGQYSTTVNVTATFDYGSTRSSPPQALNQHCTSTLLDVTEAFCRQFAGEEWPDAQQYELLGAIPKPSNDQELQSSSLLFQKWSLDRTLDSIWTPDVCLVFRAPAKQVKIKKESDSEPEDEPEDGADFEWDNEVPSNPTTSSHRKRSEPATAHHSTIDSKKKKTIGVKQTSRDQVELATAELPGTTILQKEKDRSVYYAYKNETLTVIAEYFEQDVERLLRDNKQTADNTDGIAGLTKDSELEEQVAIVMPVEAFYIHKLREKVEKECKQCCNPALKVAHIPECPRSMAFKYHRNKPMQSSSLKVEKEEPKEEEHAQVKCEQCLNPSANVDHVPMCPLSKQSRRKKTDRFTPY